MRLQRGFTLIEMALVLGIVGVLISLATPMMRDLIVNNRLKTVSTDLHSSLTYARSEAIKRNGTISLVPVDTSAWAQGWSVRSGTTVLQLQDAYASVTVSGPAASVSFAGSGRLTGTSTLSFIISSSSSPRLQARCVVVAPSGRPSVQLDKDGDASNGCQ